MTRYFRLLLASLGIGFISMINAALADVTKPEAIAAAITDSARPDGDKQQDENRKPGAVLTFIDIKPGDRVADLIPGGGYYTRLFSSVVGNTGRVYAVVPTELDAMRADADAPVKAIAAEPHYANVTVLKQPVAKLDTPDKLDMVFTSMNYHDLFLKFLGPADITKVNKAIFDALKSGGVYIVLDHAAATGSGIRDVETLHRIDPERVKSDVLAAGFVFDAQSDVLRNPDDAHTLKVFDPGLRGKTDRFIFKFRKP